MTGTGDATPRRGRPARTIAILIPAYNAAGYVLDALESAARQTRPADQIVVVDDGSTDDTHAAVSRWCSARSLPVELIRQENGGPSVARNAGLARIRTDLVALLDADDVMEPDHLAQLERAFDVHADLTFAFGVSRITTWSGEEIGRFPGPVLDQVEVLSREAGVWLLGPIYATLIGGSYIAVAASLVSRSALSSTGCFDESLRSSEDRDLWLRLSRGGKVAHVPVACRADPSARQQLDAPPVRAPHDAVPPPSAGEDVEEQGRARLDGGGTVGHEKSPRIDDTVATVRRFAGGAAGLRQVLVGGRAQPSPRRPSQPATRCPGGAGAVAGAAWRLVGVGGEPDVTAPPGRGPAAPEVGIVGLVPEAWGGLWMPRHQVMTRLARYFTVLWLNPAPEWRTAWLSGRGHGPSPAPPQVPGFHVQEPHPLLPVFYRPRAVGRVTQTLRLHAAARRLEALGARTKMLYVWRPDFDYALDVLPDLPSLYHIDDEYTFSTTERPIGDREADLLRRADRVIIHSPGLWDKKAHLAAHPELVPNGVDYASWACPAAEPADLAAIPHPRIGYVGIIKHFLDIPLLLALAVRHAEWSFVFVGPVMPMGPDEEAFSRLSALPNVHLLGTRAVDRLPAYAQHLDVGIMPYDVDDYTKFIYPMKLHEYLATGVPVVGTPIRTLEDFASVISLADTVDGWSEALERAVAPDARAPDRIAQRQAVACEHDWSALTHRVAEVMAEELTPAVRQAVADAAPQPVGPCAASRR